MLSVATDGRTFEVERCAVPFEPRPEDIVLFGSAVDNPDEPGALMADPQRPPVRYRIIEVSSATFHSHWQITAERHD